MGILVSEHATVLTYITVEEFIKHAPNSVYTAMRTFDNFKYIFKFSEHMKNLYGYLISLIKSKESYNIQGEACDYDCTNQRENIYSKEKADITKYNDKNNIKLKDLFQLCSTCILRGFDFLNSLDSDIKKKHFHEHQNYKIIILAKWIDKKSNEQSETACPLLEQICIMCYIKSIDLHPTNVNIEIKYGERENPNVKSTSIYKIREELIKLKKEESDEIVLYNNKNEITEGLSSNFFCFINNTLRTAKDDTVLKGTMRNTIIDICTKENIPLEIVAIKTGDIDHIKFCFLCSTSRIICPIKKITFFCSEGIKVFNKDVNHPVLVKIQQLLAAKLETYKEDYTQFAMDTTYCSDT